MNVRRYIKEDYPAILDWVMKHKKKGHLLRMPMPNDLPQFGVFCPDVACAFLITTDCPIAYLEYFFSNPDASVEDRKEAYKIGMGMLLDQAKQMGFEAVHANSSYPQVIKTCIDNGFILCDKPFLWMEKKLEFSDQVAKDAQEWVI